MSKIKEIKRLAKKCLEEKWYPLIENFSSEVEWTSDCAFCYDARKKWMEDEGVSYCRSCLIDDLPICGLISDWWEKGDKSVIIKALEELGRTGYLSEETNEELRDY